MVKQKPKTHTHTQVETNTPLLQDCPRVTVKCYIEEMLQWRPAKGVTVKKSYNEDLINCYSEEVLQWIPAKAVQCYSEEVLHRSSEAVV